MALDVFGEPVGGQLAPLTYAALHGELNTMKKLLDQGVDVNALGGIHGNALSAAASRRKLDPIKLLIDRGADVNAPGGDYRTALEAAAGSGNTDAIALLINSGANLNVSGGAALDAAASRGNSDAVQLLVSRGVDVNAPGGNALRAASKEGALDIVKLLLDKGADVDARWGDSGTALSAAASNGNIDAIELLLAWGACVDAPVDEYYTPLLAAVASGNIDAVRLLLDRGADVNKSGGRYVTVLHRAIIGERLDIAALLIERGANLNDFRSYCLETASLIRGPSSFSFVKLLFDAGMDIKAECQAALLNSAHRGHFDSVQLLLGQGVDVNTQDNYYGTALQAAAACSTHQVALHMTKLLLDWRADVNCQGGQFGNPLQAAAYTCPEALDVVKLLLSKGADVNAQNGRYGSVLQAASCGIYENLDLIKLILDCGADVNAQGGLHGSALQAALSVGRNRSVKLLLERGANAGLSVVDHQGATLLHSAVVCRDISMLDLLLEAGALTFVGHADAFKQTPLYIAIDYPESFQSLKTSLDMALKSTESDRWISILNSAINEADFDGRAPLHRAVENKFVEAAEWLIHHGANVHARDFNNVTAFQRACQMNDFGMMSQLFPHVAKDGKVDRSIKATDWRAAQDSNHKENVVLALNGLELPSVQAMDGLELAKYFHAISYPLDYRSTSSVSAQDTKCIATASFQRALVLLRDDSLLNHTSNGVYLRWWRKELMKTPGKPMTKNVFKSRDNGQWHWKLQLNQFPSAVALTQPSRAQCFLECRLILPSCEIHHTATLSSAAPLKIRRKNHAMVWILVKPEKDNQPSTSTSSDVKLECKVVFTTLEDCEIPELPDDEILIPCIKQIADEWKQIFQAAEKHLSAMRSETFRSNGRSRELINAHLSDAQTWNEFRTLFSNQMSILRLFHESFFLRWRQLGLRAPQGLIGNPFVDEIENTEEMVKERFLSLDLTSQELIQLEFNLTSIAEAQKSTTMNRSMKRLSWITFIFLPLMFIASLFGMNIDLLASNPSWWLYIPFATGTIVLTLAIWILFKTKKGLEDTIEERLRGLFKRSKVGDEESLGHLDLRKQRMTYFSAFGKKRS